jgi:hypothetical protein
MNKHSNFYSYAEQWRWHSAASDMRLFFVPAVGCLGLCVTEVTTET